jgi:hypothetical protein
VSNGIYDFFKLPYNGLRTNGPQGFIYGLTNGSISLIHNMSAGTITSLTSLASFVSRNMDILSMDPHHLARQENLRYSITTSSNQSTSMNLVKVTSGFILSIMGAIGGLAEQPIQSVHNSDSIIKGFSKGIIGLVTKPVGAVAEVINQTGQNFLRVTGVNRLPSTELRLQRQALHKSFSRFPISITKCEWKLIATSPNNTSDMDTVPLVCIHTMLEAVGISSLTSKLTTDTDHLSSYYLILSNDILYVIDKDEDMLLRAFYISQISVHQASDENENSSILVITLNDDKVELLLNEYDQVYETKIDRLHEFVEQSSKAFISKGTYKIKD